MAATVPYKAQAYLVTATLPAVAAALRAARVRAGVRARVRVRVRVSIGGRGAQSSSG